MDLEATAEGLCGFRDRSAGTEAERRAAGWLRDRLGAAGGDAAFEVLWVEPHWPTRHLLAAVPGAAGGLRAPAQGRSGPPAAGAALVHPLLGLTLRRPPRGV